MASTQSTRRSFFARAAATAAFSALSNARGETPSERFWQAIRQQFAFDDQRTPMNAANLCPSPIAVADRVAALTHDIDADCSFQNRDKFADLLEGSRAAVAKQLGVSPNEIALVRNTSEANNIINNGLPLEADNEVLIWDQNHPTNNVAWAVRAKRFGFRVASVSVPAKPGSADELIEPFRQAFTERTRVLALTHASNVSGLRLPIRELAELAHAHEIHVHVDGAQTWGALDVDLRQLGCDSYTASAHKWFCGPKEVGLLYVREEKISAIWPGVVAPGWGEGPETTLEGARKFESMGQRDDDALAAVGATAEFHSLIGPADVERRVLALAAMLKEGLQDIGARLVTPEQPEYSAGVCIIEVPAANRGRLLDGMYRQHGIAGSTSGGFRLCPHIYNTRDHVQRAIDGLDNLRELWI